MSEIFGVDIAAIVNDAFGGQLHALTLHKASYTTDVYGVPVKSEADHSGEGVRSKWRTEVAVARGYPVGAAKIIVLQNGITAPAIGDAVTIDGERWQVIDVDKDPVGATWSCAATQVAP